jgi:undecaprenyl-diphosphatase
MTRDPQPTPPEPLPSEEEAQRLMTAALIAGLLAAAAALMLFTWLGREVLEGEALRLDSGLRTMAHAAASPTLTAVMVGASFYGGPVVLIPAALVVALAFLVHGWQRGALLVVLTVAGAALLNWLLKFSFGRTRPEAFFDYPLPGSPSFPSGHALYAASIFGGMAALLTARLKHGPLRVVIWSAAVFLILLVGFSRVYLGVHYPSDVLAGYSIAIIWVTFVALGDRLARHRRRSR